MSCLELRSVALNLIPGLHPASEGPPAAAGDHASPAPDPPSQRFPPLSPGNVGEWAAKSSGVSYHVREDQGVDVVGALDGGDVGCRSHDLVARAGNSIAIRPQRRPDGVEAEPPLRPW